MDEMKHKEPWYSGERAETTALESPSASTEAVESLGTETIGQTYKTRTAVFLELVRTRGFSSAAEFVEYLKRTRRVWLMVAGGIVGVLAMATLVKDVSHWVRNARERRQEQAVASVTPDRLIARCGPPAEDLTKEVYPILMRTMSYQPRGEEKLLVAFSRTAEEKSDWVFLSMKGEAIPGFYDTPAAKLAALPCLDSKK